MQTLKPSIKMAPSRIARPAPAGTPRMRGSSWQKIRAEYFRAHPLCAECQRQGVTRAAQELDHVVPLWKGGSDAPSNYQGLCRDCHQAKTADEARERMG